MSVKSELESTIQKIQRDKKRKAFEETQRHAALEKINVDAEARAQSLYDDLARENEYLLSMGVVIARDKLKVVLSYQGKNVFAVVSGNGFRVGIIEPIGYQRLRIPSDQKDARNNSEAVKYMMANLAKLIEQ